VNGEWQNMEECQNSTVETRRYGAMAGIPSQISCADCQIFCHGSHLTTVVMCDIPFMPLHILVILGLEYASTISKNKLNPSG